MDSPGAKQQSVGMANLDTATHSYLHTELERRRASLQTQPGQMFRMVAPPAHSKRG